MKGRLYNVMLRSDPDKVSETGVNEQQILKYAFASGTRKSNGLEKQTEPCTSKAPGSFILPW